MCVGHGSGGDGGGDDGSEEISDLEPSRGLKRILSAKAKNQAQILNWDRATKLKTLQRPEFSGLLGTTKMFYIAKKSSLIQIFKILIMKFLRLCRMK
jgi:hypothetical protein